MIKTVLKVFIFLSITLYSLGCVPRVHTLAPGVTGYVVEVETGMQINGVTVLDRPADKQGHFTIPAKTKLGITIIGVGGHYPVSTYFNVSAPGYQTRLCTCTIITPNSLCKDVVIPLERGSQNGTGKKLHIGARDDGDPVGDGTYCTPLVEEAASQRCADNHNKALHLYNEGKAIYDEGVKSYEAFNDLEGETTSAFTMDRIFKREAQINYTKNIIAAVVLLDTAISKTSLAKDKIEKSNYYGEKAKEYCYDDDYESAESIYNNAQIVIARINKNLFGKEDDLATRHIAGEDFWILSTPDYSMAKYETLAGLIRIGMTEAAIYLIENDDIELSHIPEANSPLLILAAERGRPKIAQALIENGANIDGQDEEGYSALAIAALSGDYDLFTYLFNKKASVFQLNGFNSLTKYKACNLADMVYLSSYSDELKRNEDMGEHLQILDFLKTKGLTPVCNLNPLIAKVNGKPIHQNDIDFAVKVLPEFYDQNSGQPFPDDQKSQYEKDILNYLVSQRLSAQAAMKAGIEINSEVIEEHTTEIHNREDNFKIELIRRYVKNELLVQKVIQQEVIDKISIQNDELQQYYANNPDKFTQSELIHASHILMSDKTKLVEVLSLAKKEGSNFAKLAEEYSEGPSSINGGDLGFFKRGLMVKPFNDSAFALNEGEISDIVETQFGFHIIKLIERKAGGVVPFSNVKDRLQEWMKSQKIAGEIDKWTEALRTGASIEIL